MKNFFLLALAVFMTACHTNNDCSVKPLSQQMVEAHGLVDFDCNRKHKDSLATTGWDYVSGLVASSILKAYEFYPEKREYIDAVKAFADFSTSASGDSVFKAPQRVSALGESNVDDLAAGKIYFALYHDAKQRGDKASMERYKNASTMMRNKLKYQHSRVGSGLPGEGGFWHKKQYPNQMWLDGLYMAPAFYAQWQSEFGAELGEDDNNESWDDIARQFLILHEMTFDEEKQLCYHGWSATAGDADSFWATNTKKSGCSPEFWARSMGWYFGALTDVLEVMPQSHKDYKALVKNYRTIAAGLARWQDKNSGLWYQLLQYDSTMVADGKGDIVGAETFNIGNNPNYLESSASCMFVYCFYKGVRLGLLDPGKYTHIADHGFEGVCRDFLFTDENGKLGIKNICASAGLGPRKDHSRTGTINYYLCGPDVTVTQNEGKAIGTFIMMAVEREIVESRCN